MADPSLETAQQLTATARATGAWSPVLTLLQQRWRAEPSEDLAEVLDALTAEANRTLPRVKLPSAADFHARWCAIARGEQTPGRDLGPAWTVGWLASHLAHQLPPTRYSQTGVAERSPAAERVALLEALGADPRIASAIRDGWALGERSRTHRANQLADVRLLPVLLRLGDRRSTALVQTLAANSRPGNPWFAPERVAEFEALPARPAPEWRSLLASADEDELFRRVAAAPDDLRARHVLADWLQERGDPRGEFVALQLGPGDAKGRKRAAALLKQHRRTWLGPLDEVLTRTAFERGFLAEATLALSAATTTEDLARLVTAPRFATVDALWPGKARPAQYVAFLTAPMLAGVRRAAIASLEVLELLLRHQQPLQLEHLEFASNDFTEEHLKRLARHPALASLSSVGVIAGTSSATEEKLAARVKAGLGARLRQLEIETTHPAKVLRLWPDLSLEGLVATCSAGWCELRPGSLFVGGDLTTRHDLFAGSLPSDVTVLLEGPVDEAQRQVMETKLKRAVKVVDPT